MEIGEAFWELAGDDMKDDDKKNMRKRLKRWWEENGTARHTAAARSLRRWQIIEKLGANMIA